MKLALIGAGVLSILVADATAQSGRSSKRGEIWKTLAERYDKNKDGKLTRQEYTRGDDKFAKWDRNDDGVISSVDFDSERRSRGGNRSGGRRNRNNSARLTRRVLTRYLALPADSDANKKVSSDEWQKFCDKLDCDKNGIVSRDEMPNAATLSDRAFGMVLQVADANKDGKLQLTEVDASFVKLDTDKSKELTGDEIPNTGNRRRGGRGNGGLEAGVPRVGEAAPDFDLPLVDQPEGAKQEVTIKLSSFAGKKPVALIFGSYT